MDADALAARHIVGLSRARRRALVVLRADAKAEDVLAAYVHGYMLLHSSAPMVSERNGLHLYSRQG